MLSAIKFLDDKLKKYNVDVQQAWTRSILLNCFSLRYVYFINISVL